MRKLLWILNNGDHQPYSAGTRPFTLKVQRYQIQKRDSTPHDGVQNSTGKVLRGNEKQERAGLTFTMACWSSLYSTCAVDKLMMPRSTGSLSLL